VRTTSFNVVVRTRPPPDGADPAQSTIRPAGRGMTTQGSRVQWLITGRDDLLWLSGACTFSFLALAAFGAMTGPLGLPRDLSLVAIYVAWTLLFDGTHFFATYSRTLLDTDFRREQRALLWASAIVFVAGPGLLALAELTGSRETVRALSFALNRFAITWAYYHLCRQHWGVVALYRRRIADTDTISRRLEATLLLSGLALPYLHALIHLAEPLSAAELERIGPDAWRAASRWLLAVGAFCVLAAGGLARQGASDLGKAARLALRGVSVVALGIGLVMEAGAALGWFWLLEQIERGAAITFALALSARLGYATVARGAIHWPKWILLGAALTTHNVVLFTTDLPVLLAMIVLTLFHNVQYHRIVRFHNVNRYAGRAPGGLARSTTVHPSLFWAAAVGFSTVYLAAKATMLAVEDSELATYVVAAALWGIPMHHYVLDAAIWRPSRSTHLQRDLHLRMPEAAPAYRAIPSG
jgi:hypothetical protein